MDCKYCQEFQSNMSCLIQQITRGVDPCDFALFTVNNDYQARYRKGGGIMIHSNTELKESSKCSKLPRFVDTWHTGNWYVTCWIRD